MFIPVYDLFNMYNDSVTRMRHVAGDFPFTNNNMWSTRKVQENTSTKQSSKTISIKDISFNVPIVTVKWSDGTETVAIDDRLVKYQKSISVNEEANTIVFLAGDTKLKMDYKRWKTNYLTQAIVKKLVPNYFDILNKYI